MKKNLGNTPVVAPLPVLIVATYDEQGTPNAMNAAWGGQCGYHHVALNLALGHKTTENLKHTKAFTLSIATLDTLYCPIISVLFPDVRKTRLKKRVYTLPIANLSMHPLFTNIL